MKSFLRSLVIRLLSLPLLGPPLRQLHNAILRWCSGFVIARYVRTQTLRRLHLGAGTGGGMPGWLNTDIDPSRWPTVKLDATKPFPLPTDSFDAVFTEHMIEHIPLAAGQYMLGESYRVLKPGGILRVATPDLARIVALYGSASEAHQKYLQWSLRHVGLPGGLPPDVIVINSLFHDHGHRFLYDEATLTSVLRTAGFVDIVRYAPGQSDRPEYRNLELHHLAIGHDANNFETLLLQARKP